MLPVLIITLCRYEHFIKCIESLQNNEYARQTQLYIGLDYPTKESHWTGYKKIERFLENGVEGFEKVYIIKHPHNLGPTGNYDAMKEIIYRDHEGLIYTEDDNVFSSNYLKYMNICMERFGQHRDVMAVSGYMYPIPIEKHNDNILKISMYFSAFGFGMRRDRSDELDGNVNMKTFLKMYRNVGGMLELKRVSPNQYCNFVKGMVEYIPDLVYNDEIRPTDLAWGIYAFFNRYKIIFPVISKVKNNGYDGSGANCSLQKSTDADSDMPSYREFDFSNQIIDLERDFVLNYSGEIEERMVNEGLAEFFCVPARELFETVIVYFASLITGRKGMASIIKRVKKLRRR